MADMDEKSDLDFGKELLRILVCPKCGKDFLLSENKLICNNCRLVYDIVEDVPKMLIEEARAF